MNTCLPLSSAQKPSVLERARSKFWDLTDRMPALHDTAFDPSCQQAFAPRSEQFHELIHIFLPNFSLLFPNHRRKSLERGVVGAQLIIGSLCCSFWFFTIDSFPLRPFARPQFPLHLQETNETRLTPVHIPEGNQVCPLASPRKQSTQHARTQSLSSSQFCTCGMSTWVKLCLGLKRAGFGLFREEEGEEGGGSDMKGLSFHCSVVDISLWHSLSWRRHTISVVSVCLWFVGGGVFVA